jgi:hypothetical protein
MSGRSLRGARSHGVSQGSGSVLQALAGGRHIERWVDRVPRASSLSRGGGADDGSIRRVPVRGRCLGSLQGVSFSRGGVGGGLGLLPRFRAAQPPPNGAWCSVGLAKAAPPRTAGGRRQGHQRFDRAVAVGRKRPRLAVPGSPVPRGSTLQPDPPKRSSWRETTVYLGSSQEAARRAPEPGARNPENTRDAGFRLDSLDGRSRSVTSWQETPSAKAAGNDPV